MIEQAIQRYYRFFDETLESSTFVVLFITLIIFFVGALIPTANAETQLFKSSIFDAKIAQKYIETNNIVSINGVRYEIYFSPVSE